MQLKANTLSKLPPLIKSRYPFCHRNWQRCDYLPVLQAMQQFTTQRNENTQDEIWFVEHNPVYTRGQRVTDSDIIQKNHIPIINTDRGGKITYHGPGQLVIYPLLNLKKLKCHLRMLVDALENTLIQWLQTYQVEAYAQPKSPGVYIKGAKVASLGLRIHKIYSYHGLAINIDMDLTPFKSIHPCGLKDTPVTQLADWIKPISITSMSEIFLYHWYQNSFYSISSTSS